MDRNDGANRSTTNGAADARATAADRLRHAVNASANGGGSRDELQAAARALVAELRGRHETPEQMLVQMKALLAEAGLHTGFSLASSDESRADTPSLYRDIITWSIRYYYDDRDR